MSRVTKWTSTGQDHLHHIGGHSCHKIFSPQSSHDKFAGSMWLKAVQIGIFRVTPLDQQGPAAMNRYPYASEPSAPPYPATYPFSQQHQNNTGTNGSFKTSQSNYHRLMRNKLSSCRCCSIERIFIIMAIFFVFLLIFLYNACADGGDCFDDYQYDEAFFNSSNINYTSSELIIFNTSSPMNSSYPIDMYNGSNYYPGGYYRSYGWHGPSWITWLFLGSAARNAHRNNMMRGAAASHMLPKVMNKASKIGGGGGGGIFGSRIGGRGSGGRIGGRGGGRGKGWWLSDWRHWWRDECKEKWTPYHPNTIIDQIVKCIFLLCYVPSSDWCIMCSPSLCASTVPLSTFTA